ncbi:hypothetical protein FJT64_004817 [Amphibalanus amphitrite]|uniref:Uncharacterized protein n=1 Tax=Amphibalanus amphitrite TaxID=1232801 RepID=A0A6A4W6X3_AMPAM|nr:hypothetical protein FJT64_004817 [Amphibalanus amphitrite]
MARSWMDSWEFHPHNQNADEPVKPLRCIIEADRIGEGLMIGIANYTSRSYKFRNDEPLGFLTQAQVIPFSELLSPSTDEAPELSDLVTQLKERQYDAISKTIENQKTARRYQRDYYNRRARDKKYELGDLVYLYRPAVKPGDASKLTKKWEPGYVVVGLHDNGLTYEVRKPGSKHPPEKVHCDRLKTPECLICVSGRLEESPYLQEGSGSLSR